MKIAILLADYVNHEFLTVAGDLTAIFRRFFIGFPGISIHPYAVWQHQFPQINDYDAFVITGSRFNIFDDYAWLNDLKKLINEALSAQRKVIGFCFGHQLLAHVLGGKVETFPAERGNYGLQDLCITQTTDWMQPKLHNYKLLFNHKYFVKKLPEHISVLAATPDYIQMFAYRELALGLQAHPEYSIEYQRKIMGNSLSLIPYNTPDAAEEKQFAESAATMQKWLLRFLFA